MKPEMKFYGCFRWLAAAVMISFALIQLSAALIVFKTPIIQPISIGIGLLALIWVGLFGAAGFLIIRQQANAGIISAWVILGFIGINLIRQFIFTLSDYERGRFPFLLMTSALIGIIPLLYLTYRYVRRREHYGDINYDN